MRLAIAQMKMGESVRENLKRSLQFMERAKSAGAQLIFFPEIQLTPFFPQYEGGSADRWCMTLNGPEVTALCDACRSLGLWASPNLYLEIDGRRFDSSLFIDDRGQLLGISKMVHVLQAEKFYEADYYTPADDGFKVYQTSFGRVGVVICFDRHMPESIRCCARQGADLVLIPTANVESEPLDLFEWEVRVQAMQNTVWVAMCNRVGAEGTSVFAGQSLVADPDGDCPLKADGGEQLLLSDIDPQRARAAREYRPYLKLLRPECYGY